MSKHNAATIAADWCEPAEDDDRLGYQAVQTGPDVPEDEARVVPIDPPRQHRFEQILWALRQR